MSTKAKIFLLAILIVTVLGGIFILPSTDWGREFRPWRLGLDLVGGSHLVYEVDMSSVSSLERDTVMSGLKDVIERRVNLFGVSEPQVLAAKQGDSYRLIVELAGVKDISSAIEQIGETPFLVFAELSDEEPVQEASVNENGELELNFDPTAQFTDTELTGRYIQGAAVSSDPVTGQIVVSLVFTSEGEELFAEITERNIGKPVAIILDDVIISAPVVQQKITGGQAQITGIGGIVEARELVQRLNAGALPAPINLISQQTIGATLGASSLETIVWAGIVGTALVIIFMLMYYRKMGIYAALALLIYIVLVLSVFKLFFTMTLAGIAGILLSIGVAVDANILIFERTKEELRKGASREVAITEGFERAWPSIRDSNITTIITSLVLYYLTSSFIRGFALSLLIGVLISMFTAITITRSLMRLGEGVGSRM
ncbi:MAG: protein translocase subunit SecD [bacterium]|nr:protein translocase subunit SecD [bacterium]